VLDYLTHTPLDYLNVHTGRTRPKRTRILPIAGTVMS
jgi:hypothetical protein